MTHIEYTKAIEAALRRRGVPELILPDRLGSWVAKTWTADELDGLDEDTANVAADEWIERCSDDDELCGKAGAASQE